MFSTPPLDPSSSQARRWLTDELSKGKYGSRQHWLERFLRWLADRFGDAGERTSAVSPTVLVVVLAVIALAAAFGLSRLQRDRHTTDQAADAGVFEDSVRSARELREAARQAHEQGDLDTAFLTWFRAITRAGVERALVPERAGATAHEVADQLATAFPDSRADLATVAVVFDRIRYGDGHATVGDVDLITGLDEALRRSRPAPVAPAVTG